jgi:hypothetical protein
MAPIACKHAASCNMAVVGPILWSELLTMAAILSNTGTINQRKAFVQRVLDLTTNLPCQECCMHWKQLVLTHGLEKRLHDSISVCVEHSSPESLFALISEMMNKVRDLQGKSQMPLAEAAKLYDGVVSSTPFKCSIEPACGANQHQRSKAPRVAHTYGQPVDSAALWIVSGIAVALGVSLVAVSCVKFAPRRRE